MVYMGLEGCGFTELLEEIHLPQRPNGAARRPAAVFQPLLEAGITEIRQVLEPGGTHVVAATELAAHLQLFGVHVEDTRELRRALNRLTLCLNNQDALMPPEGLNVGPTNLSKARREVRATHLVRKLKVAGPRVGGEYPAGQQSIMRYAVHMSPEDVLQAAAASRQDAQQTSQANGGAGSGAVARRRLGGGGRDRNPQWGLRDEPESDIHTFFASIAKRWAEATEEERPAIATCAPPEGWASSSEDEKYEWLAQHCTDAAVVFALYDGQDAPREITGEARRNVDGKQQECWCVTWEDTIIHRKHLAAYQSLGYFESGTSERTEEGEPYMDGEGILVEWKPSYEPKVQFERCQGELGARLVASFLRRQEARAAAPRPKRPRPDHHLSDLEQQGLLAPPRPTWDLARPDALSHIQIVTEPVHPELDVEPPAGCTGPFIRDAQSGPGGEADRRPSAHVHDARGRWLGTVSYERLSQLHARFTQAKLVRPELFQEMQAGSFEEEVAGLQLRWHADTKGVKEDTVYRLHAVAPAALVQAIHETTGADVELFASPLNVHPCMAAYFSTHPRDQLFGAGAVDAYSRRWVGACFAHPQGRHEEMRKAVRWALGCARHADPHTPVLTVMLLPNGPELAPCEQWLAYPEVALLANFWVPHALALGRADSWQGEWAQSGGHRE